MFKNASKYRNTNPTPYQPECQLHLTHTPGTTAGVSGDATRVAATGDRIILNGYTTTPGELTTVPLWSSQRGEFARQLILNLKQHNWRAHSAEIVDFVVNPGTSILAAGGVDGNISVFKLDADSLSATPESVTTFSGTKRVNTIAYNPVCGDVFAAGCDEGQLRVLNVDKSSVVATLQPEGSTSIQSLDWNHNGSSLAYTAVTDAVYMHVGDPRQQSAAVSAKVHESKHGSRVIWLGLNDQQLLTTGFGKFRNREHSVWDLRSLDKPLVKKSGDSSSTVTVPMFDSDTGLLFLGGRADSNIETFEVTAKTPFLRPVATYSGKSAQKDICLVPKTGLDVMQCEAARIIRAGVDIIEPVSFIVPRRTKREWADVEDLFPDTQSFASSVSGEDWAGGKDGDREKVSLNPASKKSATAPTGDDSGPAAGGDSSATAPASAVPANLTAPQTQASRLSVASSGTRASLSLVRESHFRNNFSTAYKPELTYYEIHASLSSYPESDGMTLNEKYFALPWTGNGGQLAVIAHEDVGRFSRDRSPLIETGSTICDLQFSPFNSCILGLGAEDAGVRVVSFVEDLKNPQAETIKLGTHSARVTKVLFHPTASNVLVSGSADTTVKLWDVASMQEMATLSGHADAVTTFDFNYDGTQLVTGCKDGKIRIADPRANEIVQSGDGHPSTKGCRVVWLGNTNYVASTGFSKASERQVITWDSRQLGIPICTKVVDVGSRILMPHYDEDTNLIYVAGKGDTSVISFEIEAGIPTEMHRLQNCTGNAPQSAIAWWPKRHLDIGKTEIARFYRLCGERIEPVKFTVPRTRKQYFQDDIYPETRSGEPACSSSEWFDGGAYPPLKISVRPEGMDLLSTAPAPVTRQSAADKFANEVAADKRIDQTDKVFNQFVNKITDFRDEIDEENDSDDSNDFDWD